MKNNYILLRLLTLGLTFLVSINAFAAKNECYSAAELKDFKTLYIKLQNQLNYEGQDAYLDKNMQVQLKPHAKDTPYPGKEFETALFSEYQNSIRKIGKLYQDAKYGNDENFKSNETLVNFMKAIEDKSSNSEDYIAKTKIKDVIDALEMASKKKYANSANKKFIINSGDKYLLEKLLTHSQDRVCSVSKYIQTQKDTNYFKADYLLKVKNAPLNLLVSAIQTANIEKDSKIDLKASSNLTADLVDTDITIKSAITENLNELSAWVKKIKAKGANCLAAIRTKSFANNIQGQIQGCNFGLFMDTLGQNNVDNLESVLHFINANEKLLDFKSAKAETSLDELKLEGFISKTFDNLGTEIKCTIVDSANSGDKKIFIRNLPYDEKSNTFDTSSIECMINNKPLSEDICKKQFDLISDSLGRGIELKPKDKVNPDLVFSIKDAKTCSNIAIKDLKSTDSNSPSTKDNSQTKTQNNQPKDNNQTKTENNQPKDNNQTKTENNQPKDNTKNDNPVDPSLPKDTSDTKNTQIPVNDTIKDKGPILSQKTDDSIITPNTGDKPNVSQKPKDETTPIKKPILTQTQNNNPNPDPNAERILCEKKKKDGVVFVWMYDEKKCVELLIDDAKAKCEEQSKGGYKYQWSETSLICEEKTKEEIEKQTCEDQKKEGFIYKWDADKKTCTQVTSPEKTDTNSDDESLCQDKNQTWVNDVNGGTPKEKYRWDGKECKDMRPAEDKNKNKNAAVEEKDDGPSEPKTAPTRFVPINIRSRQMYLMPGMP